MDGLVAPVRHDPRPTAPTRLRRKAAAVDGMLRRHLGPLRPWSARDPLGMLIGTILSQHTSDTNSDRAYARLRRRLRTWEAVRAASTAQIAAAIRPAGLSALKAPRIQAVLRRLAGERRRLSLAFLRRWPRNRVRRWLRSIPGVGPKTAAIVMQFGLGKPAFPVDTHVDRVGRRLGLIPAHMSTEDAHTWMEALVPPARYGPFHRLLVRHGREICTARRPRCEVCPVRRWCDYARAIAPAPPRAATKSTRRR
jgi:endonuclease III